MLKLEVGKFYKTRDGNKRGPLVYFPEFGAKPYGTMRDEWWSEDGLRTASDGTDGKDLIAEWHEVAMETGTLKELNVKPGDVVECVDHGVTDDHLTVGKYYGIVNGPMIHTDVGSWWGDGHMAETVFPMLAKFRIISRAAPNHDLTAITTPFGLLDEATQEALRAHGGPYEMWDGEKWYEGIPSWYGDCTYRVKPSSVIETVTLYGWPDQFLGNTTGAEPLIMTYQTFDGEPDWSTLKVEAR